MTNYIPRAGYNALVAGLVKAATNPEDGDIENSIKIALGEIGDTWPDTIADSPTISEKMIAAIRADRNLYDMGLPPLSAEKKTRINALLDDIGSPSQVIAHTLAAVRRMKSKKRPLPPAFSLEIPTR